MIDYLHIGVGVIMTLGVTSVYSFVSVSIRKRVRIGSPESQTITEMTPAVNALLETNGPMMQGIIAILEAQQGKCNGNVAEALEINRKAKKKFDNFLIENAKIGGLR